MRVILVRERVRGLLNARGYVVFLFFPERNEGFFYLRPFVVLKNYSLARYGVP